MPEGDTVWRAARGLDRLAGEVLASAELRVPQHVDDDLGGATVRGTGTHGKHLLTRLLVPGRGAWTLHTHLRMEGSWHVHARGDRWRRPAADARAVLRTDDLEAVGFSLGVVELLPTEREGDALGHLGPDLLGVGWDGAGWDEDEALTRLRAAPEVPVHEALLDQRNLAGLGNMYAAELLFVTGTHPATPVGEVRDLARLVRLGRRMLQHGTRRAVQSTTGDLRPGRRTWVHRQERGGCQRCGTPVRVDAIGPAGRERAAYWCPRCQPMPASSPGQR